MAKKKNENETKSSAQLRLETMTAELKEMPIDKWEDFIASQKKDEQHNYKVCARRALKVKPMKQYIVKYDNTQEAKDAFENASLTKYTDSKGEEKTKNDIVKAVNYFIDKYLPDLKVEPKSKGAFSEEVEGW